MCSSSELNKLCRSNCESSYKLALVRPLLIAYASASNLLIHNRFISHIDFPAHRVTMHTNDKFAANNYILVSSGDFGTGVIRSKIRHVTCIAQPNMTKAGIIPCSERCASSSLRLRQRGSPPLTISLDIHILLP